MSGLFTVNRIPWLLVLTMILSLVACLPEQNATDTITPVGAGAMVSQRSAAPVEAIDIVQDDRFPVRVSVIARGRFSKACTSVDQIRQERRGSTFLIAIDSVQYTGESCPENQAAFEETIPLDVIGLPAGIYVVDVNGLQGSFKLQRDNIPDMGNAVLGGLVWLDRCRLPNQNNGQEIQVAAGCVDLGDGRYGGDGIRAADEAGIGGVKVYLGAGICPSAGLATTLTAPDGTFLFSGLTAGDYCLTVDSGDESDGPLAGEGLWTFPDGESGQQTVSLGPGESNLSISMGWSAMQSTTEPVFFATPASKCTNKALFVADLTVPDDTPLAPGAVFTKTWRLQNLGSCIWDPDYSLVFAGGEQMSAAASRPLTITVAPGEFADISVSLAAPDSPGEYRGEWKLADPEGALFGIGPGSDRPFWVQIVVLEAADDN